MDACNLRVFGFDWFWQRCWLVCLLGLVLSVVLWVFRLPFGWFCGFRACGGVSASLTWCLPVGGLLSLLAYVLCFGFGADSVLLG